MACRDYVATFQASSPMMAIYTGWFLSQTPSMRQAFRGEWDPVLLESFGGDANEAWKSARSMAEVARDHPDAFAGAVERRCRQLKDPE